ncbi:neuraminidase-like domain-containing protein [Micromonospora sp. NPDC049497]|uniref:neuraminidase-like domain-containing protein n=1 Tax=Micromonospora sp. NPDC049497 TaxID=3364273 RepID=UPI0037B1CA68
MPSITVQVSITVVGSTPATPIRVEATVRGQAGIVVLDAATLDPSGRYALTYDTEVARDLSVEERPLVRLRAMAGDAPLPVRGRPAVWPYDDAPDAVEILVAVDDDHRPVAVPGTVSAAADGAPLPGLTVTAILTAGPRRRQTLASVVSDQQGAFRVVYDPEGFPSWAQQKLAAVSLEVTSNDSTVSVMDGRWRWAVGQEPDRADILVDVDVEGPKPGGEPGEPQPRVSGTIRHTDGSVIAGVRVEAVQLDLVGEQVLASATTGADGTYQFAHEPEASPLFIRVINQDGRPIAASPPVNGAASPLMDVYVRDERLRGPSDFLRVHEAVAPLIEGHDLAALRSHAVGVLVRRTGLHRKQITPYLLARRQAAAIGVDPEALYGLIRTGGTRTAGRLLNASEASIVRRLASAGAANIVSLAVGASGTAVYRKLRAALARDAAARTAPGAFGALLMTTSMNESQRSAFVARHLRHAGDPRGFWAQLRTDPEFGPAAVDDVQLSLHLGVLTENHQPLVAALRSDAGIRRARDLVRLTETDWLSHIRSTRAGRPVGVPASIPGAAQAEREAAYARRLVENVERAWPTASVAARMRGDDFTGKDLLVPFLEANEDFDFARTPARAWLISGDAVLPDGPSEELLDVVTRHQRLFRIASSVDRWRSMLALDAAGIASARDVVRTGKHAFVTRFASAVGGEPAARAIYESAAVQASRAANLVAGLGTAYQGPAVMTVPDVGAAVAGLPESSGLPEWRTLFGSIDFCACEHCRSILSPAAYLTDLLHWLEDEGALQPLRERRPDLFALELSCENTNTVVPHVDLVLEVLENRVAGIASLPAEEHTASTLPSEVLLAHPEYLNQRVYDGVLATAAHPFDLPFDLTALQTRVYLEQQGVRRPELMEAFRRGSVPSDVSVASEDLGLTSLERRLVTGRSGHTQQELWGFPAGSGTWTDTLAEATRFLDRSGLSFPELLDLLHVTWVNPGWRFGLVSPEGESHCDLAQMTLLDATRAHPESDFYDRARRFVRLWRRLDWSIIDLDKVLIALDAAQIDDAVIESISHIRRIRAAVRIDLPALLSLWGDLDMKLDRPGRDVPIVPLYDRVFLDRAVVADEATWPFRLDENRDLALAGDPLSAWTVELQAALGMTAEELDEILEPDMTLAISTLSRLHRTVVLARALKLPVGDVLTFRELFARLDEPADPFVADDGTFDTRATLRFIDEVRAVNDAGFTADDLLYLLGHDADAALSVGPDETAQSVFLTELQAGLLAVEAEAVVEPDPTGEITQQLLSEIVEAADLDAVLALIDGTTPVDPAERERLYATYLALFITDVDPRTLGFAAMPAAARYAFVLERLVPYLATVRKQLLVRQKVASLLALEPEQSDALLALAPAAVLDDPTAEGTTDLLGVFMSRGFADAPVLGAASDHAAAFATLTLLDKIAMVFGKLGIGVEEQAWLLSGGIPAGMLDPAALPLAAIADAAALYVRWRALREALRLRDRIPGSTPSVIELLTSAGDPTVTRDDLLGLLRDRTGWSFEADSAVYSDLRWLADEFGFNRAAAFRDGTALHTLADSFGVLRKVGVTAQQAAGWASADVTPGVAGAVVLAAKADYEPTRWYDVARPLRNKLRDRQCAALVSWLVSNTPGLDDPADLFADVLVDVEMDPCMLTSRIVQAIGSVQLYVQRCFLNLETPDLGAGAEERWAWMRNYRVWEANRRVFLYPENWLWPELRDDKSEIFTALETDLLQAPITDATAEQAYLTYLQSLLQVSRLEIVAYYHEEEEDAEAAVDVLHVFGRTPNLPRVYFYRRRAAGTWSPWAKVDLDIEGDHLIPVIHNRRMMVFWPIFIEQALDNNDGDPPAKFLTVQLAHSENRDGGWTPKQVSQQEIDTRAAYTGLAPSYQRHAFQFRPTRADGGSLEIECIFSHTAYDYDGAWSCGKFIFDDCTGAVLALTEPTPDAVVYPTRTTSSSSRLTVNLGGSALFQYDLPAAWFSPGRSTPTRT